MLTLVFLYLMGHGKKWRNFAFHESYLLSHARNRTSKILLGTIYEV